MSSTLAFLVFDSRADSRFLLVKTLFRKFPHAVLHECTSSDRAREIARRGYLSAIILHRDADPTGTQLIRDLRGANPSVPIIVVSSVDQQSDALAAGADHFLHFDEWLRIGSLVEELLATGRNMVAKPALETRASTDEASSALNRNARASP